MTSPIMARLDLRWDPAPLAWDVLSFGPDDWCPIRSRGKDYPGSGWSVVPLVSRGGDPKDGSEGDVGDAPFQATPLLARARHVRAVLDSLRCPLRAVRLSRLEPHSTIAVHTDVSARLALGHPVRLHVPIITTPHAELEIAGQRCDWAPGELWYGNFALPHSAVNKGPEPRVHLLIVAEVTDWLLDLFPPT